MSKIIKVYKGCNSLDKTRVSVYNEIKKYNPYHGPDGKFTTPTGAGSGGEISFKSTLRDTLGTWEIYDNDIIIGGEKVGEVSTEKNTEDDRETFVEYIQIDADKRNQGLGTKALKELAKKEGRIFFAAEDENSQRLYDRIAEPYDVNAPEVDQGFGVYYMEGIYQ